MHGVHQENPPEKQRMLNVCSMPSGHPAQSAGSDGRGTLSGKPRGLVPLNPLNLTRESPDSTPTNRAAGPGLRWLRGAAEVGEFCPSDSGS